MSIVNFVIIRQTGPEPTFIPLVYRKTLLIYHKNKRYVLCIMFKLLINCYKSLTKLFLWCIIALCCLKQFCNIIVLNV